MFARKQLAMAVKKILNEGSKRSDMVSVGSSFHKIGTIFSRTTGLLKSKSVTKSEIPLWYHVYQEFPPKYPPRFDRKPENVAINHIFYPEDKLRAKLPDHFDKLEWKKERQGMISSFLSQRLAKGNTKSDEEIINDLLEEAAKKTKGSARRTPRRLLYAEVV